jgi:hypothetical protein
VCDVESCVGLTLLTSLLCLSHPILNKPVFLAFAHLALHTEQVGVNICQFVCT